ncbi:hypothetical protein [Streptomyces litchfieldiae]|uniref:Nucleotidyltransferase domain-containing protein n=1 Tax=Streptomyces litchfieldiae TaxID=3075543 RepID=A0ABU2MUK2_9ACTN|nr:hypothetical protein [Streptomyces sp. DSM 44938]MDT0344229.1 hypothetical protein [Streptomyces sp. DSM 44938]
MRADTARAAAADWVRRHAGGDDSFRGAYFSGSTVGLPPGAEVPLGSDVDVMVVTEDPEPPGKPGKFRHRGALLEVTLVPWDQLADPERVLSSYHVAGPFRTDTIIADPRGDLRRLHETVARRFAEPRWVRRRRDEAYARAENGLRAVAATTEGATPWPGTVLSWLFPAGVTTHVLLVAGLRNPTVRLRYLAARDLLAEHGMLARYEELLRLLGCDQLDAGRAEHHLTELARTFDAAAAVAVTPFPFGSDITPAARPIAIDASLEHIRAGRHREVVFWLAATFARCHLILAADAPEPQVRELTPPFAAFLADLGITSPDDLRDRARACLAHLPAVLETSEEILQAATSAPAEAPT